MKTFIFFCCASILLSLHFAPCFGDGYKNSSMQSHCYYDKKQNLKCYDAVRDHPYKVLLGIGAGKTGTTAFVQQLSEHSAVMVGSGSLGGGRCCYGETYFFFHPQQFREGWNGFTKFFHGIEKREDLVYLADKTPKYSWCEPVTYNAKLFLADADVKLVFSFRDRFERDVSEYFMRLHGGDKLRPYEEDLLIRIEDFRKWTECRERLFSDIYSPVHNDRRINLEVFSIEAAAMIAGVLHERCGQLAERIPLQTVLYERNLYRWAQAFGKDKIFCFPNDEMREDPAGFRHRIESFLNLDSSKWHHAPPAPQEVTSSLPSRMESLFGENATAMTVYLKEKFYSALATYAPPTAAEVKLFNEPCLSTRR